MSKLTIGKQYLVKCFSDDSEFEKATLIKHPRTGIQVFEFKSGAKISVRLCHEYKEHKNPNDILLKINDIMWESHMVKGVNFGKKQGDQIMKLLEDWAEL
jgi:hypothetical protein